MCDVPLVSHEIWSYRRDLVNSQIKMIQDAERMIHIPVMIHEESVINFVAVLLQIESLWLDLLKPVSESPILDCM